MASSLHFLSSSPGRGAAITPGRDRSGGRGVDPFSPLTPSKVVAPAPDAPPDNSAVGRSDGITLPPEPVDARISANRLGP